MGVILPEHLGCDQNNAFGRNMETVFVCFFVKPNAGAIRDSASSINDSFANVAMAADIYLPKNDSVLNRGERMHTHL